MKMKNQKKKLLEYKQFNKLIQEIRKESEFANK